jgi:hypothetical protein
MAEREGLFGGVSVGLHLRAGGGVGESFQDCNRGVL